MRNLSDALRTVLEPHHRVLKQAAQRSIQGFIASAAPSSALSAKQQNRQRRYSLYEEMKALAGGGTSQSDIARQLDLSLRTVQRWTRAGVFPERTPRSYAHSVDAYLGIWINAFIRDATTSVSSGENSGSRDIAANSAACGTGFINIVGTRRELRYFHPPNSVFALRLSIRPG